MTNIVFFHIHVKYESFFQTQQLQLTVTQPKVKRWGENLRRW
jgi:hypothetical protein